MDHEVRDLAEVKSLLESVSEMQTKTNNPFIDVGDADNTCMYITSALAMIRYFNVLEASNDHSTPVSSQHITGQNLVLEAVDEAVRFLTRMPPSKIDGPMLGQVNDG